MKVTVCFDETRVVVPCKDGQLLVGELIALAVARYKKAIGKSQDVWITVHNLKSLDGGILDSEDKVADVLDDKDLISATYDCNFRSLHLNNGDGTSASSVGTSSPDVFHSNNDYDADLRQWQHLGKLNDVLIMDKDLAADSSLKVRRGSDPSANYVHPVSSTKHHYRGASNPLVDTKAEKRSSQKDDRQLMQNAENAVNADDGLNESLNDSAFRAFMRSASRKSLTNGTAMAQWLEAQERIQNGGYTKKFREEPIGSSDEAETAGRQLDSSSGEGTLVEIQNPGCSLGIHVTPYLDNENRNAGLKIVDVEPGSPADTIGRLHPSDCIIEINGTSLRGLDFSRAQNVFCDALKSPIVRLRVQSLHTESSVVVETDIESSPNLAENAESQATDPNDTDPDSSNVPSSLPAKSPGPSLSVVKPKFSPIANTRVIGQKLKIGLVKGENNLGFTVAARDNQAGSECPIYIKKILPQGAAIVDGRLQPGDRLLEINGIDMLGKSQAFAVSVLRSIEVGGVADLVISRQSDGQTEELSQAPAVEMEQDSLQDQVRPGKSAILRFNIKKGQGTNLDLSIMGRTRRDGSGTEDAGIFVQSILDDGAAAKDGRLRPNDQILEINGESVVGLSLPDARDVLQCALQKNPSSSSEVSLVISRSSDADGEMQRIKLSSSNSGHDDEATFGSSGVVKITASSGDTATALSRSASLQQRTSTTSTSNEVSDLSSNKGSWCSSLNEIGKFDREGLGRRSMSEKRKAFIDPTTSNFYQKIKDGKGQKKGMTLTKSGSVESLLGETQDSWKSSKSDAKHSHCSAQPKRSKSTKAAEVLHQKFFPSSSSSSNASFAGVPLPKSRTWNESFRLAVDQSYAGEKLPPGMVNSPMSSPSQFQGHGLTVPHQKQVPKEFLLPDAEQQRHRYERTIPEFYQDSSGGVNGLQQRQIDSRNDYFESTKPTMNSEWSVVQRGPGVHDYRQDLTVQKMNGYSHLSVTPVQPHNPEAGQMYRDTRHVIQPKDVSSHQPIRSLHDIDVRKPNVNQTAPIANNRMVHRYNQVYERTMNAESPAGRYAGNAYAGIADSYPNLSTNAYPKNTRFMTESSRELSSLPNAYRDSMALTFGYNRRNDFDSQYDSLNRHRTNQTNHRDRLVTNPTNHDRFMMSSGALV